MENKRLSFNDVPDSIKSVMRERFESDPRVRLERTKAQASMSRGNFAEALLINKKMEDLFCQVVLNYMEEAERNVEQVDLRLSKLPTKDVHYVLANIMTVYIVADIMDLAIYNANECLLKNDKELSLDVFDELKQTAKLAQDKMAYLCKTTNYIEHGGWDSIVDNLYKMMFNKAKSIMRNAEEYDKDNIIKPKEIISK